MKFCADYLAANIRAMRARTNQTQGDIAKKVGVNIGTVVQYESGNMVPRADKLFALAEALDCTPNDLCGWPS